MSANSCSVLPHYQSEMGCKSKLGRYSNSARNEFLRWVALRAECPSAWTRTHYGPVSARSDGSWPRSFQRRSSFRTSSGGECKNPDSHSRTYRQEDSTARESKLHVVSMKLDK